MRFVVLAYRIIILGRRQLAPEKIRNYLKNIYAINSSSIKN